MKKVILLNKKEGETPLEALEVFRRKNKKYEDVKMTYAGRLDPMASGLLLILAGEEVKEKEKYLALDKEYEFEILFGFSTDTYDILGKVIHSNILTNVGMKEFKKKITENLKYFRGRQMQEYPLYSSPTWEKARRGEEVEQVAREIYVKKLNLLKIKSIKKEKLFKDIEKRIKKVKGDFRQEEITKTWSKFPRTITLKHYYLSSFKIKCGSGTYVRGIADALGKKMKIPALAYSIKRTKVGKYSVLK